MTEPNNDGQVGQLENQPTPEEASQPVSCLKDNFNVCASGVNADTLEINAANYEVTQTAPAPNPRVPGSTM